MVIPGSPAPPRNKAYSDQPNALSTPSEINVSIVAAPWRRLVHAAWWNGHAAHVTTGAASVSEAHCQKSNWRAGIMPSAITGTASATVAISRSRSGRDSSGCWSPVCSGSAGGAGRAAV
jgi:hypothetical protein